MGKIFIVSNSFVTRTLVYNLNYILNIKVNEVLILEENHSSDEKLIINDNIVINSYKDINDCLAYCDYIFLVIDDDIPIELVEYINIKSKELNKKCIKIKNTWSSNHSIDYKRADYNRYSFSKYPVILNVSLGIFTQQFCIEILLNRILNKNKISFKQLFSPETLEFLLQLKTFGILSNEILSQLDSLETDYSIFVCSVNIGENLLNIKKSLDFLRNFSSDFTILQTEIKFDDYELAQNILKYSCFAPIDIIIKSRYNKIDNNVIYCNNIINGNSFIHDIESINLEETLSNEIFSKISFPEGFIKL